MATITGILGNISGKVGNTIFYTRNGRTFIRMAPKKRKTLPTPAQAAQRMRFALMMHFLSPLNHLVGKGYGYKKANISKFSQCMSYNSKNAIRGTDVDPSINFAEIILTTGRLVSARNGMVSSIDNRSIDFSWNHSDSPFVNPGDQTVLIAYNLSQDRHSYSRTTIERTAKAATLPGIFGRAGDELHCWIAFISPDGKLFSNSSYVGMVKLA